MCTRIVLALFVSCALWVVAEGTVCQEFNFPPECSCYDFGSGPELLCSALLDGAPWDIKSTFDEIAEMVNNDTIIFQQIAIMGIHLHSEQEIEENTITSLKTLQLTIIGENKFSSIHPNAFPGTYEHTKFLSISGHTFLNAAETFEFFNKFVKAERLYATSEVRIPTIPENAFEKIAYQVMHLSTAKIESVGDFAFTALENLRFVSLSDNNITEDGISKRAFEGMTSSSLVDLERNRGITHLSEEKFKAHLDNAGILFVGDNVDKNPIYFLHCDERADWICDNGYTSIHGYFCKESDFTDIFDYCGTKGFSVVAQSTLNTNKQFLEMLRENEYLSAYNHKINFAKFLRGRLV